MAIQSAYAYERALNDLQQQHAATTGVAEFGRSLGQRRFCRDRDDFRRSFTQSQPSFGGGFAQRGMLNSGMYKQGQRDRYRDYQQTMADMGSQQQLQDMQWTEQARQRDAGYQNALLRLMEDFQAGRATQNPFENFRLPQTLTQSFEFSPSLIGGGSGGGGGAVGGGGGAQASSPQQGGSGMPRGDFIPGYQPPGGGGGISRLPAFSPSQQPRFGSLPGFGQPSRQAPTRWGAGAGSNSLIKVPSNNYDLFAHSRGM
jgi:hypothetical protein